MRTARLTADLLARKGEARGLADTYGTPLLDPMMRPASAPRPARTPRASPLRTSCSLRPEDHRRLRILAARSQRTVSELVREAVQRFLDEHRDDCACVAATAPDEAVECCRGGDHGRAHSAERA
jgi:predicted DNA-binding protein